MLRKPLNDTYASSSDGSDDTASYSSALDRKGRSKLLIAPPRRPAYFDEDDALIGSSALYRYQKMVEYGDTKRFTTSSKWISMIIAERLILDRSLNTRQLILGNVTKYASMMDRGVWGLSATSPIVLAKGGANLNGQTRMEALLRHKEPVQFDIGFGDDPETFRHIDTEVALRGVPTIISQIAGKDLGLAPHRLVDLAAMSRKIVTYASDRLTTDFDSELLIGSNNGTVDMGLLTKEDLAVESLGILEGREAEFLKASSLASRMSLYTKPVSARTAIFLIMTQTGQTLAFVEGWFEKLITKSEDNESHQVLKGWLARNKKEASAQAVIHRIIYCWNKSFGKTQKDRKVTDNQLLNLIPKKIIKDADGNMKHNHDGSIKYTYDYPASLPVAL